MAGVSIRVESFAAEANGDVNEAALRRIQIRKANKAHFDKDRVLPQQDIKVLTLFFINKVGKNRTTKHRTKKTTTREFEEEYNRHLNELPYVAEKPNIKYAKDINVTRTHRDYFSKRRCLCTVPV